MAEFGLVDAQARDTRGEGGEEWGKGKGFKEYY